MTSTHYVQPLLFGGYEHGPKVFTDSRGYVRVGSFFTRSYWTTAQKEKEFGSFHSRRRPSARGLTASLAATGVVVKIA